jgi:hypothetical protein
LSEQPVSIKKESASISGLSGSSKGAQSDIRRPAHRRETVTNALSAELGYDIIGPLCFGFANWLVDQAKEQGIRDLYFLSRDGWLLKKAFDLLPKSVTDGIRSHYLYSSRRAVWFASLKEETGEAEFKEILSGASPFLPVASYLLRIDINPSDYGDEIRDVGFASADSVVKNAGDREKLYALFDRLRPEIMQNAAKERADYLAYMEHAGVFDSSRVGLVDVGWTGSILKYTRALAKEVDPSVELFGYFLGVGEMAQKKYGFSKGSCLYGYLFDFDDWTHREILKSFYVIEKFLSPNEPSLIRMKKRGYRFSPVYKNANPEVSPLNFVVQNNALQYVRGQVARGGWNERLDTAVFLPQLKKLLRNPDPGVARLLSQYSYSSDFGYQAGAKPIAKSLGASAYLRNPMLLLRDYRRARWKAGFIAQQPLPARALLRAVRRARLDLGYEKILAWSRKLR